MAQMLKPVPVQFPALALEFVIGSDLVEQGIPRFILADGIIMHDAADVHVHAVMPGDVAEAEQRGLPRGIHFLQIPENDYRTAEFTPDFFALDPQRPGRPVGRRLYHNAKLFPKLADILDQNPIPPGQTD